MKSSRTFLVAFLALLMTMLPTLSNAYAADNIDKAASIYASADGFKPFADTSVLNEILDISLTDTGKARKDADVTALEKALLLLEANETFAPRARYVARIGIERHGEIPVSFVEVERYNFGPLIWQDAVDSYGEENTAPVEEFGDGPHVAWRVVTQPNTTSAALILAASRREITNEEASSRDCIERTCLSFDAIETLTAWSGAPSLDLHMPKLAYGLQVAAGEGAEDETFSEQQSTALIALELAAAAGLAGVDENGVMWTAEPSEGFGADHPFARFVIDRNLGQDVMSEGFVSVEAMDADLDRRWIRIATSGTDDGQKPLLWTAEGSLTPKKSQDE